MQVTPNQKIQNATGTAQPQAQQPVAQPPVTTAPAYTIPQCNPGYIPPQVPYYPQAYSQPQIQQAQPQNVQVPATAAGVNIQIFNPSAGLPGAAPPTYNVNAPCYPSSYYTTSLGQDGRMHPNTGAGTSTQGGSNTGGSTTTDTSTSVNTNTSTNTENKKKTEKRKILELNDDYIRMLEGFLNSQDGQIRLNAAKEVYDRLEEDESRCNDRALTALINKMLQDPSDEIRLLALTALEGRLVEGDDYSINVLKRMQQSDGGYGQDAVTANKILLQRATRQVEKEFEVKDNTKKTETTTSRKTEETSK